MAKKKATAKATPTEKKKTVATGKKNFFDELHAELSKVEKSMSDQQVRNWIEKTPVGKAITKAYTNVHG